MTPAPHFCQDSYGSLYQQNQRLAYLSPEVLERLIRLGIDQDETVIRRRLRIKMEFLRDAEAEATPATDADLSAYLAVQTSRLLRTFDTICQGSVLSRLPIPANRSLNRPVIRWLSNDNSDFQELLQYVLYKSLSDFLINIRTPYRFFLNLGIDGSPDQADFLSFQMSA